MKKRLFPLGRRTKVNYARALERAYGKGVVPDHAPDLSIGGRHGAPWPEASRATLRAAIIRYWTEHGDEERGYRLALQIEIVEHEKRDRARPLEAEVKRFERTLRDRQSRGEKAATICFLALQSGGRSQELLSLEPATLESALKYGTLELDGKGNKQRSVPVFERTKAEIRSLLKMRGNLPHDSEKAAVLGAEPRWRVLGHLLAGPSSKFTTQYNMLNRYVKDVTREAGLDAEKWSPHTLRRIYASRLTRGGAPVSVVQKALGHAFVTTTQRYIDVEVGDIGQYGRYV